MIKSNSREVILKKVRQALGKEDYILEIPELASPVLKAISEDITITFAENFVKTKAAFYFCENERELWQTLSSYIQQYELKKLFAWEKELATSLQKEGISATEQDRNFTEADAGITFCEALVARTGSILISSGTEAGRRLSIFPPTHIVIGATSQIVPEISEGLNLIKKKYPQLPSMVSLVTGPSRTADIEKTLVLGAHGPKELVLFLLDDSCNT